jgi:hypothetical protein
MGKEIREEKIALERIIKSLFILYINSNYLGLLGFQGLMDGLENSCVPNTVTHTDIRLCVVFDSIDKRPVKDKYKIIGDVRGKGLVCGIEFVKD